MIKSLHCRTPSVSPDNGVDVVYLIQEECSVVGHGGTDNMLRYCLRVAAEDQGYIMPWDARAWS